MGVPLDRELGKLVGEQLAAACSDWVSNSQNPHSPEGQYCISSILSITRLFDIALHDLLAEQYATEHGGFDDLAIMENTARVRDRDTATGETDSRGHHN